MSEPKKLILHGDLELHIIQARHLPNMDITSARLRRCFTLGGICRKPPDSTVDGGDDGDRTSQPDKKNQHRKIITSDPYVTVSAPQTALARTRIIPNSQYPVWDEHFRIPLAHPMAFLEFRVKDDDLFGAEIMGKVKIPAESIATGDVISGWFPIIGPSGKPPKPNSALKVQMKFFPYDTNSLYTRGIASDPQHLGVRNTYFPLRKGSSVKLYQDAHVSNNVKFPDIKLEKGTNFEHNKCWEDICYAISEAHHLIYIVGWSVYHKIKLIREPTRPLPRGGDLTLGELLKYKSQEGVRVLLLVWDDKTSHDKFFINTAGVMGTHDEETKKFFKHSSVICVLSPRYASSKLSIMKQQVVGTMFTHHQKCILVDTQAPGNNRKITAFLGGLDLCDGRYDTPEHRLFRDLDTVFKDDFHQPQFPPGTKAPREPWHDLHCRIDGPAAYDVLINFAQRWRRATKWREFAFFKKTMSRWNDDAMLKIERISWILSPAFAVFKVGTEIPADDPKLYVAGEDHPENWHVQIFRSIDSGSVQGFPKSIDVAKAQNLISSKDLVVDKSIESAYIQAIRSAQHFIYIENQYFLGSSYAWPSYKDAGADHLVPMELALKIASKIRARERFCVYVVLPMWPEGDPKSVTGQEILYWQSQTMQMMYQVIARELKSMQLVDSHPLDYLNFYCLGNREANGQFANDADKVSDSYKFQRFMIYVHAKGMIVDDEYVILGSANINQRSLAGSKDTEIAMGAYQPHHSWAKKQQHPRGQVYGYRMSLWAEHLGMLEDSFQEPEAFECVKRVNEVAEDNWKRYTAEIFTELQGHLLKYPIQVDADGKVCPLPDYECFPDVGGKILGNPSPTIPDVLTT
ncbi:phospholipase D delta-like [Nicotiana tabacum]|uniref:Phospholipase D n=2 Tax=Nicotiana TaxID=4085 RepID=A0A1S3ZBL1_TOBAC|nr:PREDICTED: phospholipase D delta-like [Nicotiana sylvestris]XP_016461796.1 PREDICTED: phospholipase D delta-like [Nicotiana tabacum]